MPCAVLRNQVARDVAKSEAEPGLSGLRPLVSPTEHVVAEGICLSAKF